MTGITQHGITRTKERGVWPCNGKKDTISRTPTSTFQYRPSPGNTGFTFKLNLQGTTIWSFHSTHEIHGGGIGGQTDGFTEAYENPPVPRRLVGQSDHQTYLQHTQTL